MASDRPTRRKFVIASAVALAAGCNSPATTGGDAPDPTPTATPGTPTTPDATETPEPTETPEATPDPAEDRTVEQRPNVNPAYQGRFITTGRVVDNFENLARWEARNGGRLVADGVTHFAGLQALSFEGRGRAELVADYSDDPVDLTDSSLSFAANFQRPNDEEPTFYLFADAPDASNRVVFSTPYTGVKRAGWQRIDIPVVDTVGSPDLSDVRTIRIGATAADNGRISFHLDDLRAVPRPDRGKLIFRFDDSHALHYDEYFPVLEEYGYPGIEAVVKNNIGNADRLTVEDLHAMQDAGWDLCHHTTDHQNITTLSPAELRRDIEAMSDWFAANDIERGTDMYVHTYGAYDAKSLDVLGDHFAVGFADGRTTNYSLTNPLTVGGFNAEKGMDRTKGMIDRVAEHRSLGVLMFHEQYSRAEFRELVEYVARKGDSIDVISGSDLRDHLATLA